MDKENIIISSWKLNWQTTHWEKLTRFYHKQQKLRPSLLFWGLKGVGKWNFSMRFSEFLCCENNFVKDYPCLTCHACHLFSQNAHPDFLLLKPEKESSFIKINQIREMQIKIHQTSRKKNKIILIYPTDSLNLEAINALLKVLEEPPECTQFLLVSHEPKHLPPTLLSRCLRWYFPPVPIEDTQEYLGWPKEKPLPLPYALGTPLLKFASQNVYEKQDLILNQLNEISLKKEKPITVALMWTSFSYSTLVDLLYFIHHQAIKQIFSLKTDQWLNEVLLRTYTNSMSVLTLYKILDKLSELKILANSSVSFNIQLIWEDFLSGIMNA